MNETVIDRVIEYDQQILEDKTIIGCLNVKILLQIFLNQFELSKNQGKEEIFYRPQDVGLQLKMCKAFHHYFFQILKFVRQHMVARLNPSVLLYRIHFLFLIEQEKIYPIVYHQLMS